MRSYIHSWVCRESNIYSHDVSEIYTYTSSSNILPVRQYLGSTLVSGVTNDNEFKFHEYIRVCHFYYDRVDTFDCIQLGRVIRSFYMKRTLNSFQPCITLTSEVLTISGELNFKSVNQYFHNQRSEKNQQICHSRSY